jgi:hypothetical protein
MPTFMTRPTFDVFANLRRRLVSEVLRPATEDQAGPGDIFVPWAGDRLAGERGIYIVGIAVDAEPARGQQSFEACLRDTEAFCGNRRHEREHSPFWQFLDGMTRELLGAPYYATTGRWGWSNLLKICWSEGSPDCWPTPLIEAQREACTAALREEFMRLHESLVFVGKSDDFGILHSIVAEGRYWNTEHEEKAGIWWFSDTVTGNLYIHGYHPNHARQQRFFAQALASTVQLAGTHLRPFI